MAQPKPKPLLPTLKEKKRYFLYQCYARRPLPPHAGRRVAELLEEKLGVQGAAAAGLLPIAFNSEKQQGIIKTSNNSAKDVRAAMLLINSYEHDDLMVQPLLMTGILRKAKQAM